jgi:GMP synthase-like glutamine amidotransferase
VKPIAIFRASPTEGPGYFATYLDSRGIAWQVVKLDSGDSVPRDARKYSGLVFMGGPMSVNDDLPWIAPALELARDAVRKDVPLLGHCLGGQLMAKALGGVVKANPVKEIGWGEVRIADNHVARHWMGNAGRGETAAFESFHWHGETFSIPPGGTRIMESAHCVNQAFALGRHLGMQCHVEMTRELIESWLASGAQEIAESRASPGVQDPAEIRRGMEGRLARLSEMANRLYDRWLEGLSRA